MVIDCFAAEEKGASVGQDLLGMKYQTSTRDKVHTQTISSTGLTHLKQGHSLVLQGFPGSEEHNQVPHYSSIITECLTLIISIWFLR